MNRSRRSLRRWAAASVAVAVGRAVAPIAVRVVGVDRLAGVVAVDDASAENVFTAADVAAAVAAVDSVMRRLPRGGGTCLTRSLARLWAGRGLGLPLRFVLGVRTVDGAVQAHAWLELSGEPFAEKDPHKLQAFQRIYEHPPGAASSAASSSSSSARSSLIFE
jgi:hypothetical protein